jgi:hypothetical protein
MEQYLAKLQALDRPKKVRIAIILTTGIMIAVIVIWLFYFNSVIGVHEAASDNQAVDTHEFSFWQSIKRSTANIVDKFTGAKQIEVKGN